MRILNCFLILATLCCTAGLQKADAQTVADARTYRVVAYKKGNNNISSVSNTTEVVPNMTIYIPNSFTPNGDGLNDTFGVHGEALKEYRLLIYNRWGQKIFESTALANRWDGTFEGIQVPEGTYVYQVSAQGNYGKPINRNGTVHLVY